MNCILVTISLFMLGFAVFTKGFKPSNTFKLGLNKFKRFATTATAPVKTDAVSHPAYQRIDQQFISEYGIDTTMYTHIKSGAQIISVKAPDDNKVFGITFRTPPKDSTGVPHILEHSVLCGSKKYPSKEPFVDLLKGSLQNFLNAFTYPDRTCYPVASTNTKDFYNLVNVYLDAVLNPRAVRDPLVLQQEGWHYELEDPASPLSIKGVVYNEMKGVYSSPDSLVARATQQALFPDNTYGVDSGGDPVNIPDLTFDQFKAFHESYYHPSNSRIFFYGDDDVSKRLELLDGYLKEFDKIPVTSQIKYQPRFKEPKKIEVSFPLSPGMEPKQMVVVNWMINDKHMDAKDAMAFDVLDNLLLGTSSATLQKALTESQLGESVTGGGLSTELLQATFSVGMKGVKTENAKKLEELIYSLLKKTSEEGFEKDAIEAAINTMEFRLREFNTGGFPKGLSLMLGMMSEWIYDYNPTDGIRFETPLKALKDDLAQGKPVFQDLIKKYLIDNKHRVTVEAKPDAEMDSKRVQEEEKLLAGIKNSMSPEDIESVIELTRKLKEAQSAVDSPEVKATLPRLDLSDIDPVAKEIPIGFLNKNEDKSGATIITHPLQTSGILYTDVAFDYSQIEVEDLELLPLFSRMLIESGTEKYDQTQLSRKIGSTTGGIGFSYFNDIKSGLGKVADSDDVLLHLMMRGKAVADNVPLLFELFSEILLNANLNNQKRAVEMLKSSKVSKEASILSSGHSYGATRLGGQSSFLGYLGEITGGLTSVRKAGDLLSRAENDWDSIYNRLLRMREVIIRKGNMFINLTADEKILKQSEPIIESFLNTLPKASSSSQESLIQRWKKQNLLLPKQNEAFTMPSQVNYVVLGGPILKPGEPVSGAYSVVSRYLSTGYLWDQVRVIGGAYGGFARFSDTTGRFVYMSYRDPNLFDTLKTYINTPIELDKAADIISSEEILQSVVGSIGDLDSPMSADQKGYSSFVEFLVGETPELRQAWRTSVLNTKPEDFKEFAKKLRNLKDTGSVVVFGNEQSIEQANKLLLPENRLKVDRALNMFESDGKMEDREDLE